MQPDTIEDGLDEYLSNDEFDALAANAHEPLAEVPAGFPSMHSRFPAVVSRGADASRVALRPAFVQPVEILDDDATAKCREELRRLLRTFPGLEFEPL